MTLLCILCWALFGILTAYICYVADERKYGIPVKDFAQMCLLGPISVVLVLIALAEEKGILKGVSQYEVVKAKEKK